LFTVGDVLHLLNLYILLFTHMQSCKLVELAFFMLTEGKARSFFKDILMETFWDCCSGIFYSQPPISKNWRL